MKKKNNPQEQTPLSEGKGWKELALSKAEETDYEAFFKMDDVIEQARPFKPMLGEKARDMIVDQWVEEYLTEQNFGQSITIEQFISGDTANPTAQLMTEEKRRSIVEKWREHYREAAFELAETADGGLCWTFKY